jgi:hypothetical protein
MSRDFDVAEERARLAAADLLAAADHVIATRTIMIEDVRDDVDSALLSRRFTSYAPSRQLDNARDDLDVARSARTEIGSISATLGALAAGGGAAATLGEAELIGRLIALAADCERRAVLLRS